MADRKTGGATPNKPTAFLGNARATAARNGGPTDPATTNAAPTVPPVQQQHGTDPAPVVVAAASNLAVTADQQPPGGGALPFFHSREMRAAMEQPFNIDEFMADTPATPAQGEPVASGSGQNPFQHFAEKAGLKLPKMPSKPKLSMSKVKKALPKLQLPTITNHSPSQPGQANSKVPNSARAVTVDETGHANIVVPSPRPVAWLANRPAPVDSPRHQAIASPQRLALARLPAEQSAQATLDHLQPQDWALDIPRHPDLDGAAQGSDSGASTDESIELAGASLSLWPDDAITDQQIDQLIQALRDDLPLEPEKRQQ